MQRIQLIQQNPAFQLFWEKKQKIDKTELPQGRHMGYKYSMIQTYWYKASFMNPLYLI